jgi:dTDP-glucose 4,6-dehydratase/UDP-glucose 4-epimerase
VDVNGINKLAGEWYHLLYNNVYGVRACALRLTNTYGPGMRVKDARQTFLGIWIRNAIEGKPILVFGYGLQRRDFNYVDDAVEAMLLAALDARADGQVFNLGSKEVMNLKQLAEILVELHPGARFEIVPFPPERKAIDIGDYYSNYDKIENQLGWHTKVDLRQGLAASLAYYGKYQRHYWDAT